MTDELFSVTDLEPAPHPRRRARPAATSHPEAAPADTADLFDLASEPRPRPTPAAGHPARSADSEAVAPVSDDSSEDARVGEPAGAELPEPRGVAAPADGPGLAGDATGDGFELCGALPAGTTVLEASAGTGKTYAIVGLAVRFVAEAGVDVSQLLLVTFSRAATQELRERTRDKFVAVAAALADPGTARDSDDELIRHLAQADPAEVGRRRTRLLAALSDFDSGTIATTHSFCQRMLDELGLAYEHDPRVRLVENVDDLVATVADDLYLARYARTGPPFSVREAHQLAAAAVQDRHARLVPDEEIGDHPAAERVAFAAAVRAETERRKRISGLRDFDDLLVLLHEVLADPVHGDRACRRIRERYRVALVDEFQDTDPLQWDILRRAFHGHATLVLVGDPKQAIYAFRGAEVLSYLDAVAHADTRRELTTNRRSDAGLLGALEHLMAGAALGHKEITVPKVAAVRPHTRLTGTVEAPIPLRVRCFRREGAGPRNGAGFPAVGRQRARVADDVAADIARLLDSGTHIGEAPLGPGDVAVLVRTRAQIDIVRAALTGSGWRRCWRAAPASSAPRAPSTGCGCCGRWSSRTARTGCGWRRALRCWACRQRRSTRAVRIWWDG